MDRRILILVGVLTVVISVFFVNRSNSQEKLVNVTVGDYQVTAILANTPKLKMRGLMGRGKLDDDEGMLFTFDSDENPSIWMKNMSIPIDILWINYDNEVSYIVQNASPCPLNFNAFCPIYTPPVWTKYVLEVPSNFTGRHNVTEGTVVAIPLN